VSFASSSSIFYPIQGVEQLKIATELDSAACWEALNLLSDSPGMEILVRLLIKKESFSKGIEASFNVLL
jgi:hypothetical protein